MALPEGLPLPALPPWFRRSTRPDTPRSARSWLM